MITSYEKEHDKKMQEVSFKIEKATLWFIIKTGFSGLLSGADFVGQIGKHIPQSIIAEIVYWILAGVVFLAVCVGVMFVLYKGIIYLYERIEGDIITLSEVLISLAFIIFFAEIIKSLIPINSIALFIMIFGVYAGIRVK